MTVESIRKTLYKCTCEHTEGKNPCGKSWETDSVPSRCAKCKRPNWNNRTKFTGRKNKPIVFNGKAQSLTAWSRELNVNEATLRARFKNGWPIEDVLVAGVYQPGRKPKEDKADVAVEAKA